MTQTLIDKGYAYRRRTATSCTRCASSRPTARSRARRIDELRAGARVQIDEFKHDPLDFVLWKHAKPGEPVMALALGPRPSGLAHRMLRDVDDACSATTSTCTAAAWT